ncbi:MAG: DNA internalization-related competence protein ComEC/Rec2 [Syntrophomonadaceae bacterium]|nr:DNA internalization-related competence protein ComEC/Rec2 [Syntrophomonadaceae bacterium]
MNKLWPLAFFSMAAGIILAYYELGVIAICLMTLLLGSAVICKRYSGHFFICMLLLLAGFIYAQLRIPDMPASLPDVQGFSCSGRVQDFPTVEQEKTTFIIKADRNSRWEKKIRVVCYFEVDLSRGDCVALNGVLKPPRRPGNPGEFDYPLYLSHNGIYYNLSIKNSSDLQVTARNQGALKWLDEFRARGETLAKENLPPHEAAILLGMLLGTREGIDEDQYKTFQKTGIIHLFSVSGLHVGFLLLLVGWIVSLLGLSKGKRFLVGTAVLLLYGTMIAWPVCVIRSIFMGILGLAAYYFGRKNDMMNALAIAGVFNLLIDPAALFTISFQLTFLATWGLIFIFPRLREVFPYKGWIWDLIWLPLAAELAVLPMIAYYFNILTPVSIITNILVSYISGAAVIIGFIALFLAPFIPFLATLFLYPAGFCTEVILFIVNWVQYLPGGYIWVATPGVILIVLYYAGIVAGVYALGPRPYRQLVYPAAGVMLLFIVVLLIPAGFYNRGMLEVDFIDVGQGDAILIKTPQGKFILLDGGGSNFYDVGDTTVLPYLHRRGIRSLRMIINSHPDNDHLQGLESVAKETPVGLIAVPQNLLDAEEYRPLKQTAQRRKIPWHGLSAGQEIKLEEGVSIKILHPGGDAYKQNNCNNQSVVLRISYQKFSLLLTGDIEKEAMQSLLDQGFITATTVVKVPHHGSKGSLVPEFYDRLNARYAIISVGSNNLFGHPNPAILSMLKQANTKILRTDQNGAVIILTDGRQLQIRPKQGDGSPASN